MIRRVPRHTTKKGQPEYHLSCAVRERLDTLDKYNRLDAVHFHIPNEGQKSDRQRILGWRMGVRAGAYDWCFLWKDGCGMIELKAGKNTLSDDQGRFAAWMTNRGVRHAVARSLPEVEAILREWGVLRG